MENICIHCSHNNPTDSNFCNHCGAKLVPGEDVATDKIDQTTEKLGEIEPPPLAKKAIGHRSASGLRGK